MILYMKKYYIIVDLAEGDEFFVIFMSESVQQCTSSVGSILAEGCIKEFIRGLFKKKKFNTARDPFGIQWGRYIVWLSLV